MKKLLTTFALAGLLVSQASSETLAAWLPSAASTPEGAQYASASTQPVPEIAVPEFTSAIADRVNQGAAGNEGAVWPGSIDSAVFDPSAYTSFALEVAADAEVQIDSFTYFLNTYGFERTVLNAGTPEEEIILSTIQLRLRSSLDDFAEDIASAVSLPSERVVASGLEFNFDLTSVAALQTMTGEVEFRLYIWEESEEATNVPFMWIDMSSAGATFDGTVTDPTELEPVVRDFLVGIFPEPKPASDPPLPDDPAPNNGATPPSLVRLGEGIASVEALRVGQPAGTNRGSVWPGSVNTIGFSEANYLETTIQPAPGATFSIAQYTIPRFVTYGSDDGGAWQATIRSSVDGFTNDLAMTSGEGAYRIEFDLSQVAGLQDLVSAVTLRVYIWETALVEGEPFDIFMWFDIAGNATGTAAGIEILGSSQLGSLAPPAIASARFAEDGDFVVEAINLTPGRTYGLFFTPDLAQPFVSLGIEDTATETTLSLVDNFADIETDPRAFYQIQEVQ